MISGVQVQGLKQFRRDLNKIDPELTKQLRVELLNIGKEIATEAAGLVPQRSGTAARSIRAGVSGNNAYIAGGKQSVPYYGWLDFGSRTPNRGNPRRVGPWKGSGSGPRGGRFIYPTIQRNKPEIERKARKAFENAIDSALKRTY